MKKTLTAISDVRNPRISNIWQQIPLVSIILANCQHKYHTYRTILHIMAATATVKAASAKPGSFQSMNLSKDLFAGINRLGYKVPTPVQRKALPIALAGMDIVCMSRTGSG